MVFKPRQPVEVQDQPVQHLTVKADSAGRVLVEVLDHVVPREADRPVALHEPEIGELEERHVLDCLRSGWVSSVGSFVGNFESALCDITGASFAIATASGTAALHLALHSAGVRPGDEVIIPALTFVATANAVSHCGATPHFVDSDEMTLGLDPVVLNDRLSRVAVSDGNVVINRETGRKISAVVPMHTFGLVSQITQLMEIADSFGIPVIEDAAEAVGSTIGDRHCGRFGKAGMLSFNGNKIITTGNGGAILTDDEELSALARHLSTTAKVKHPWRFDHDRVGWNYRLPNLNAALGCAQLARLPEFLTRKRALHDSYKAEIGRDTRFELVEEVNGSRSNYWLNAVRVKDNTDEQRESMLELLHTSGYLCRPAWTLMHRLPMYETAPRGDLHTAELLERELICLPSGPRLSP